MHNSNDYSNAVTAVVIILTFALAAFSVVKVKDFFKKAQQLPKRKLTQTPAQAYTKMVNVIADAATLRELDAIGKMLSDFRVEFTGYLPEAELNEYSRDITNMKKEKRFQLLREVMGQQLQIV